MKHKERTAVEFPALRILPGTVESLEAPLGLVSMCMLYSVYGSFENVSISREIQLNLQTATELDDGYHAVARGILLNKF